MCSLWLVMLVVSIIYWHAHAYRVRHSKNYCAMYDICGERSDGKVLNCPFNYPAVTVRILCVHYSISFFTYYCLQPIPLSVTNSVTRKTLFNCLLQPDDLFSAKIQSLCPSVSGKVCCTEAQFDTLRQQVQQVGIFLIILFMESVF